MTSSNAPLHGELLHHGANVFTFSPCLAYTFDRGYGDILTSGAQGFFISSCSEYIDWRSSKAGTPEGRDGAGGLSVDRGGGATMTRDENRSE